MPLGCWDISRVGEATGGETKQLTCDGIFILKGGMMSQPEFGNPFSLPDIAGFFSSRIKRLILGRGSDAGWKSGGGVGPRSVLPFFFPFQVK